MSNDPLATYLQDHLAGSAGAIELLEVLRDHHAGKPLGTFAESLLTEVKADREVLQALAERVGAGSNVLQEATAWLGEKVTRLKLGHLAESELGTFEALEALALGILGKLALWRALAVIAATEPRLQGMDFDSLASRAVAQQAAVEQRRLEAARSALLARAT